MSLPKLKIMMPVICVTKTLRCCSGHKIIRFGWWCDETTKLPWTRAKRTPFPRCHRQALRQLTVNLTFRKGKFTPVFKYWNVKCFHWTLSALSPLPRGPAYNSMAASPIDSLPHTNFSNEYQHQPYQPYQAPQPRQEQHVNYPPAPPPRSCFSPQLNRDQYQGLDEENAAIQNQVSRRACTKIFYKYELITNTFLSLVS